jgi:hypothetical protein
LNLNWVLLEWEIIRFPLSNSNCVLLTRKEAVLYPKESQQR